MTCTSTLGSYRLIAELGHGGMADVFLAAAEGPLGSGFTKLAVVKKLRSHLAEDPEFVAMLMDEARITARLSHPNVVQLFEVGHEDENFFLAMEFLEGQPLHRVRQRVKKTGADIPVEAYYAIVSDVLAGLHHAHELQDYDGTPLEVAHRDVTPHNIFVTYNGTVKVLDFGIAKATGRRTETQLGTVKGKVRYMSPEQASGDVVDRRTDIFAAGIILWNVATGSSIWGDMSDVDVAKTLRSGEYEVTRSPRLFAPGVPEAIDAICQKALAFRREDRYATADEMRADLESFLGRGSNEARKRLASAMNELFVSDRAQLRAVLEASALTAGPSIDTFTAPAALARANTPQSFRPLKAKPAPAEGLITVQAVALHESSTAARAVPAPAAVVPPVVASLATTRRPIVPIAVLLVVAVLFTVALTRPAATSAGTRVASVVASDLTTAVTAVRSKGESSPAATPDPKKPVPGRRSAASRAGRNGEPSAESTIPAPPPLAESAKTPRKRAPLDNADPWVAPSN